MAEMSEEEADELWTKTKHLIEILIDAMPVSIFYVLLILLRKYGI
jgi:hypothetical protein